MKTIDLTKATKPLSEYVEGTRKETLVVTSKGKPVIAVVDIRGVDRESLSLSMNSKFLAILERSRKRRKTEGAIPLEEIKRKYGLSDSPKAARKNGQGSKPKRRKS